MPGFRRVSPRDRDPDLYEKSLRNAWSTETVLYLPRSLGGVEAVAIANHWTSIQAYYALYSLARAFLSIRDGQQPMPSHRHVLNQMADVVRHRRLFPPPWGATCEGCENSFTPCSFPQDADLHDFSAIGRKRPEDAVEFDLQGAKDYTKATNRRKLADWRSTNKRRRVPAAIREQKGVDTKPTTLFDFLYRIRIKSNYLDADAFAAGLIRPGEALAFGEAIALLVSASMLVLETLIDCMLGGGRLRGVADEFLLTAPRIADENLGLRLPFYS